MPGSRPVGRPVGWRVGASSVPSRRVRIPADYDVQLLFDCYHALVDAYGNRRFARTHDALNKLLDDVFGV